MGLEKFTAAADIFRDEDVLRDSHIPDDLIERDHELSEYQSALKPVIKGARPRKSFSTARPASAKPSPPKW